ncbi:MAG: hypothetical protein ACM33V_10905 [Chloroflexota bacterium]|nr:hypothetical protein [Anaerolineales bacterium]
MFTTMDTNNTNWLRFLSRWALLTALNYLGLILGILILVIPASQGSSLPEIYFELVAATRAPILYRLTIALDVAAWLALGGLLLTFAALSIRHAPIRGVFIAACGLSMVSGFIGACFRLAGTSALAAGYLNATSGEQTAILQSYVELLRLINILFSAGGLLGGIGLLLTGFTVWSMDLFPRWSNTMLILAGGMHMLKAAMELITGTDLGPLALLANILAIIALFTIASVSWRRATVRQPIAAS